MEKGVFFLYVLFAYVGDVGVKKQFLEVGKIVSTHGLKGDVKVDPWCDSGEFLCEFDELYLDLNGETKIQVLSAKVHKNIVIMRIKGIDSIEKAESLRGKVLFMNRDDVELPAGEYFIQDILGLNVIDVDNSICYGRVTDVLKTGANDVYQITNDNGKDFLIPVIEDVICEMDIDNNLMKIRPLKGIFDDED